MQSSCRRSQRRTGPCVLRTRNIVSSAEPGSIDALQLTVSDLDAVRDRLVVHGADVSEVFHDASGVFHHADEGARVSGPAEDHADYGSFASFSDPDGNGWMLQEINKRLPRGGRARPTPSGRAGTPSTC